MIYLDHNATTQPSPGVIEAMSRAMQEAWQNPSSQHRSGQGVRREVDRARRRVAELIGARTPEIVFTSSGTESLDLAVRGTLDATSRRVVISTSVEHKALQSLLKCLAGQGRIELRQAPLLPGGIVDVESLAPMLKDDVALVTIQWANNETGAIQPIRKIGALCRERRVCFHCDATQWVGKMPTDVSTTPVDRPVGGRPVR